MSVKFIKDSNGNQTTVVILITEWKALNERFTKIQNKLKVLTGLKEAVEEVNRAKEGKLELKTLKDFLDEN